MISAVGYSFALCLCLSDLVRVVKYLPHNITSGCCRLSDTRFFYRDISLFAARNLPEIATIYVGTNDLPY